MRYVAKSVIQVTIILIHKHLQKNNVVIKATKFMLGQSIILSISKK